MNPLHRLLAWIERPFTPEKSDVLLARLRMESWASERPVPQKRSGFVPMVPWHPEMKPPATRWTIYWKDGEVWTKPEVEHGPHS